MFLETKNFYIGDSRHQAYIIHRPTQIRRAIAKHLYSGGGELLRCKKEFVTICKQCLGHFPDWFKVNKLLHGVENTPEQLEEAIKMIDLLVPE